MEHCTFCDAELPPNAQFCGSCGRFVSSLHELSTRMVGYQTVEAQVEDGPTIFIRPSNATLHSGERERATARHTWPGKETPPHNLPPLSDDEDEEAREDEKERRRRALLGLPLLGALAEGQPASNVPMVSGTPQFNGVPMVPGTFPASGATSVVPPASVPNGLSSQAATPSVGSWPPVQPVYSPHPSQQKTAPLGPKPKPKPTGTGTGSGSSGQPGPGGGSGCAVTMLIVVIVVLVILGTLGGLFFGLPPALSFVGSGNVVAGGTLRLHGNHFVPGSSITFTLDNSLPLFAANQSATTAQRQGSDSSTTGLSLSLLDHLAAATTPIKASVAGTFDLTIPVSTSWGLGKHTIRATESISARSTTLSFTVDAVPATLLVRPTTLDFGQLEVGSKAVLSVVVSNGGQQPLHWQARVGDASWLSLQPTSGILQGGDAPQFIYVTGDTSHLKVGTYTATLQISANGTTTPVSVQFAVIPQSARPTAKLTVTPTTLDFGTLDTGTQLTRSVTVSNTGTLALKWTADTGNANWLTLNTTAQTIQSGARPETINVTVDTTNLTPGQQNATLTINSNGGTARVAISVVVNAAQQPCTLQSPSSAGLTFNANWGTNPQAQSFTEGVTSTCTNGVTITPTVTMDTGTGWLAVSPSVAMITGGSANFAVGVTSSALSPGTYTGSISLAATSNGAAINGSPQTVSVSLTVTEIPPVLSVSPGKLPISLSNGDGSTTYGITVANTGGAPLQWNATLDAQSPSFVTLSFGTNTTLAAGGSTTVNVNVNPYNQSAGTYAAIVTVTAVDPLTGKVVAGSPATTYVSITITAAPSMQVSPTSLTFTPGNCVYKASNTVTITNTGGGTLGWYVATPVYPSGAPTGWLTVSPSGNGSGNASLTFSVDGSGSAMASGQTYTATVTITPSVGNAQTVAVSFTVPYCIS